MELSRSSKVLALATAAVALLVACMAFCMAPTQAYAHEGDELTTGQADFSALTTQSEYDRVVFIAKTSDKKIYHFSSSCSGMKGPSTMSLANALAEGYTPCEKCAKGKPWDAGAQRLWGQDALGTMNEIVNEGDFTSDYVVITTVDGYWDALSAAGLAGVGDAPILMTDGKKLSAQTENQIKKLKPENIYVCGGTAAVSEEVEAAAKAAAESADPTITCHTLRFAGDNAIGTANAIALKAHDLGITYWDPAAFICTNEGYWDALAAAPISYACNFPIFLTDGKDKITQETLDAMKEIGITEVFIVGGEAAVSEDVEKQIKDADIGVTNVTRFGGENAVETSEHVAVLGHDTFGMHVDKMGVATNSGYWDALAGAALCGKNDSVLVLVGDEKSSSISSFIKSNASGIDTLYLFGGEAVVSPETATAVSAAAFE